MKKNKKRSVFLLFKNALKQAYRNKIQLVGLAILVLLSSTIFSIMQTSVARVTNEYNVLISQNQSNIHDFIFDFEQSIKKQDAPEPIDEKQLAIEAVIEDQQLYLNEIANKENKFIWERVEARTMQLSNNNDTKTLKLITYNQYARINKLVISEGYNIGKDPNIKSLPEEKQVVINKEFALKNNLKIGDVIRVQEDRLGSSLKVNEDINDPKNQAFNWLQIVGFGTSADFITPIIDQSTPLPNKQKEGILYVSPIQFGLEQKNNINNNTLWYYNKSKELIAISSNSDVEIYYVGKWTTNKKDINAISDFLKERYINSINLDAKLVYLRGDSNYKFNNRTAILPNTIYSFTTLLIGLLLIVLLITGIIIVLITYKNINNSKPQLGILKALGYSNRKILITSLAYPMLASFIGTILVFLPASGLQILIVNTFANYFNLNFGKFVFDTLGYVYCLLLTFGFLSIIAWVISAIVVSKNPINLINNISLTRDSNFTKFVKKVSSHRPFLTRFRLALFTSSIGKMAAASLTMFLGTVLMTVSIIGPKIMSDNKIVNYTGMNYKSLTEYVSPTYNSVFTFYKTYNPTYDLNNEPWKYTESSSGEGYSYFHPDRSPKEFATNLLNNDISSEAYAPIAPDPTEPSALLDLSMYGLTYFYGKMFTKEFLQALDDSQTDPMFISIIVSLAWQQANDFYSIIKNSKTTEDLYSQETYQKIRTFYLQYRSTITMNLNPNIIDEKDSIIIIKDKFKKLVDETTSWQADAENFEKELNNFKFNASEKPYLRIENEENLLNNAQPANDKEKEQLIRQVLIWFYAIFYNRIGQTIAQGTYTQSPYFIKQNIARAFENPDAKFNVSFNVIPFDKRTDELGTYFIGSPEKKLKFNNKQYPIKVYGLQNEQQLNHHSLMQLYDGNNNALNYTLERKNNDNAINIVINQTVAKQLKLSENDIFYMATNGTIMKTKTNSDKNEFEEIDLNKINFDKISDETSEIENNASLKTQYISYDQIKSTKDGAYPNMGSSATAMLKEVASGNVVIDHENKTFHKFKISGVYNGYGQPTAFISKTNADQLLNFNETKKAFFEIFKREWQNKGVVNGIDFARLKQLTYEDFQKIKEEQIKVIFNNEFPIFNFKFSNSDSLPDINQSFSVSQSYGDYSSFGMNGGTENKVNYQGYGQGSIATLLPLYNHKQLLNQITQLINTVLLFFIIFSLIISFFIILLTSNLVIYENKKIIVTMKTLGYSDNKITNIVIGMYLPMIALMFIIGFSIGLLIIKYILNYLAFNTTWVLPFFFAWWIPVVIGLIVFGIYIITYIIEWQTMKKIKVLRVLNETN